MVIYKRISFISAKKFIRLAFFSSLFIFILSFLCLGQEQPSIQNIPLLKFPALVYTQEDLSLEETQRTSLMITTIVEGKADIKKIMSAQYMNATQLSDTLFLLEADQRPQERSLWRQTQYLVDFKTGSTVILCDSISWDKLIHYYCLRSVPERDEAVLLRYGQGTDRSTLVHVDMKTLQTKTLYVLPEQSKTPGFSNNPRVKISPDFKKLAAMIDPNQQNQRPPQSRHSDYSLRVLDLDTMKIRVIEDNLKVQINPRSSLDYGWPSFEWISSNEILYQNMVPIDLSKSQYILKCANIKDNKTIQWLTKQLPLTTIGGGNLSCDWLTGEIYFHNFLVDIKNKTLLPITSNFLVEKTSNSAVISFDGEMLYKRSGYVDVSKCVSHSKKNFAYFVRFGSIKDGDSGSGLYVKINQLEKPILVSEPTCDTHLITWIENTGKAN